MSSRDDVRSRSRSRRSEREPLLGAKRQASILVQDPIEGAHLHAGDSGATSGESFDDVPHEKRQIGLFSAIFLIFNRVVGTGIYATPSLILRSSGSVGMALLLWVLGAMIAAAGTAVYIELGTGLPRSGGEKNYLEFIYRRPKFLVSCIFAMYAVLIGWSASGAVVFGEYTVHALSLPMTTTNTRIIGVLILTVALLLHGTNLKLGLRVQNVFGVFVLLVMIFIALAGQLVLFFPSLVPTTRTDNLEWGNLWKDTRLEANAFVTGLYNVIWSFIGYSNVNYALSEVRDPVRTIKKAAPLAMILVTVIYLLVNVAYFAVVSKEDILDGGRIVAALFFRNIFGPNTERVVSAIIALSIFGNILAVLFAHGRVVQELGREGILPYSEWFASNKPFNAPLAGLLWQWAISSIIAAAPPPGDAFNFVLQLSSYPHSLINSAISAGLLFLHSRWARSWDWSPPFKAWPLVTVFFLVSNVFLAVVPLVPPAPGYSPFEHLPYFLHVVVCLGIALVGVVYWYIWCVDLPRRGQYTLEREMVIQEDGVSRSVFQKVYYAQEIDD